MKINKILVHFLNPGFHWTPSINGRTTHAYYFDDSNSLFCCACVFQINELLATQIHVIVVLGTQMTFFWGLFYFFYSFPYWFETWIPLGEQAVRNEKDLESLNVKPKFRSMNSFWKYYSGEKVAPFPTIFIGGNHEASNYLWELYVDFYSLTFSL